MLYLDKQESNIILLYRPGGMERPGDDFELTHNARVSPKDTLFGGVVSRLQVKRSTPQKSLVRSRSFFKGLQIPTSTLPLMYVGYTTHRHGITYFD